MRAAGWSGRATSSSPRCRSPRWGALGAAVLLIAAVGCSSSTPAPLADEVPDPGPPPAGDVDDSIGDALVVVVGGEGARLGDVSDLGVEVEVPAGGFPVGAVLRADAVAVDGDGLPPGWSVLGPGAAFSVDVEIARSDEPMSLRLQFDPTSVADPGALRVGYHHDRHGWSWWHPSMVDGTEGVLEVEVYHFSTFAVLSGDEAARVEEFVERRAVQEFVRRDAEARTEAQITAMVEAILREGMDIGEPRVVEIISRAVIEQVPFGSMGLALYDADIDELVGATLDTTMDIIAKNADEEGAAAEWAGDWSTVSSFLDAAREAAGGDPEAALRVMANEILDNVPLVSTVKQIGEVAVELADHVITDLWFDPEVEKAFRVYRDGAEGGWFGYDVDPGDWEQLTGQMRGVFAKIRSDHLAAYCRATGIDCAGLSPAEQNRIGDEAMELLHSRFDDRITRQDEIERTRIVEAELFGYLAERGWLAQSFSNPMYAGAEGEDLDALLRRIGAMIDRIKADTGLVNLTTDVDVEATDPFDRIDQRMLPVGAIEPVLRAWYLSEPSERPAAYRAALVELGLLTDEADLVEDDPGEIDHDEQDDSVVPVQFRIEFEVVVPMPWGGGLWYRDDDPRTYVLTLWNVGTQQEGYGTVDTAGSMRTEYETVWPSGEAGVGPPEFQAIGRAPLAVYGLTFSGGPDGDIRTSEGELFGSIVDGSHFVAGPAALRGLLPEDAAADPGPVPISDPSVFDPWR